MNVLFYSYPWAMDVPGGGERQMSAYAHHLSRFGVHVSFYDMWRPLLEKHHIFHVFSVMPSVLDMCAYAKMNGRKLVVSPNFWATRETRKNYSDCIWDILELADRVIVNSDLEGDALSDVYGMAREKFYTVRNGADAEFLIKSDPQIFRNKFSIDGPYVLNVANIEPRKNQLEFIKLLRSERPDLTMVIVGGVRDKVYAEACADAGEGRLRIVDTLPYASEDLRSAIAGCEFFAMPSLLETPSIAAIEAAVAGAKILLTRVGSTTEYFGGSVTWIDPGSSDSIKAGIRAVSSATAEHSTWVARDHLLWPQVIPSLVQCYQSLI
ncbi:glycosyltransferase [Pandoraea sp. SD6-2]|uniref:glycosyltransferase n=1 Tax=Pandoraea sp. SD6-2 TaxID=1286093 RepID=UPI00032E4C5D|nr:glycosyltransferase [Pandoraea sp. SD6-2]EON11209.1 glycosyltransferase [Pandoraea sp. SD6-2]